MPTPDNLAQILAGEQPTNWSPATQYAGHKVVEAVAGQNPNAFTDPYNQVSPSIQAAAGNPNPGYKPGVNEVAVTQQMGVSAADRIARAEQGLLPPVADLR